MAHQQNIKVLVVDDHASSRALFCEALTSAGYAVRAASDVTRGFVRERHLRAPCLAPAAVTPSVAAGWAARSTLAVSAAAYATCAPRATPRARWASAAGR